MAETKEGVIVIRDTPRILFFALLQYLYTGQMDGFFNENDLLSLLDIGEMYSLSHFVFLCEMRLIQHLTKENAVRLLDVSQMYGLFRLQNECERIFHTKIHERKERKAKEKRRAN